MLNQRISVGYAIARYRLPGLDDRRIARAAAEIALKRHLDLRHARPGRLHPQRVERHDDTRRTETALAAVEIHHRLLHRMQWSVGRGQMLDGHHMRALQHADKADAGVDGLVAELIAAQPADQYGARAAIALGAAFLRPAQPFGQPQVIEQRLGSLDLGQRHVLVVEDEAQCVGRSGHQLPR